MNPFFWSLNKAFAASLGIWADFERSGTENIPDHGALMIVANHQSNMDPPVIARSVTRRTLFPAKRGLFRFPLFNILLRMWGSFPLSRGKFDTGAYRKILSILEKPDGCVGLFPEGTRTRGSMKKAQNGPAMLAMRTSAQVLPVGITGTHVLGGVLRAVSPIATIRVNIGRPFTVANPGGVPQKEALEGATEEIMGRIAELLPESYRGVYASAVGKERRFTKDLPDA